ncbi:hypothetical protein GCM10009122_35240 [Fulvivirga kasyanovii]|uniref:Glycosyltransferase RgtA/B/C/D-like domain-containing protein n=1 Tax=Fulvivirga kasyanovii TaxID=396812 RepID=A0ABW9RU53_9BACT|nr:hypothetical protein [Fulvivirga kasyanovii]MTI27586.1 hypothetical protein [Fulvivirga kasyanovii]
MNWLIYIFDVAVLFLLAWLLMRKYEGSPLKKVFVPALLLKLMAGIMLGLLYTSYYSGGDTWVYHQEAVKLTTLFDNNAADYFKFLLFSQGDVLGSMQYHGQPRALFMVKVLSVVNLITADNYWLSSMFFSFFSFTGLWLLADRLTRVYENRRLAIALSVLFFPSVLFWSAGIIKEALAVGAMAFIIHSFLGYIFRYKNFNAHILIDLLMLFILWNTKYYYAGLLILFITAISLTLYVKKKFAVVGRSPAYQLSIFGLLCVLCLLVATSLHPNFYLHRLPSVIYDNYHAFIGKAGVNDIIYYYSLEPNWPSILVHSPKALLSGLFRPFLGERTDLLKVIAGVENLFIFLLTISAFFKIPRKLADENRLLLVGAIAYSMILCIFLALSTPNFGTLIRYKTGFLPVLILIVTLNNPLIEKLNRLVK